MENMRKRKSKEMMPALGLCVLLAGMGAFGIGYNMENGLTIIVGALAVAVGVAMMIPAKGDGGETVSDGM